LGALSSMQPPASLQQGVPGPIPTAAHQQPPMPQPPRVHHGGPSPLGRHGNSAFSAPPSAYGAPLQTAPDAAPYLPGEYHAWFLLDLHGHSLIAHSNFFKPLLGLPTHFFF
jgi:hypothetical protein